MYQKLNLLTSLGQEADIICNLNLYQGVNFKLGYSQLLSAKTMEAINGSIIRVSISGHGP